MRQVGDIKGRKEAARFASFLAGQKIPAELRDEGDDLWRVWVIDEDHLPQAESYYAEYVANPQAAKFDTGINRSFFTGEPEEPESPLAAPWMSRENQRLRAERERQDEEQERERLRVLPVGTGQSMPVTMFLIIASVIVTILASLPQGAEIRHVLLYSTEQFSRDFPEISSGQVWRLVTPIVLHGGFLHLFFNMLWLLQLGGAVEQHEGSRFFTVLVFVTAVLCNTAQYLVSGPLFVGMSGVVYMLLGYTWIMHRYQAGTRYYLHPQTMTFMMIWLVICLVGIIPNVANTQHVVGLLIGLLWGFLRSGHLGTLRRRRRFKHS